MSSSRKGKQGKKALGRGLGSILPEILGDKPPGETGSSTMVPVTQLIRNPNQTRQTFSKEALSELAQSMKEHGVLQPVIVRPHRVGRYEIVAGERRWRAAQEAGLLEIPVIIRQLSEKQAAEINLIENVQREDLNAMEEAEAVKSLINEHGYTHDELASRIGKKRSTLTNLLGLLRLPVAVQEMIRAGKLTEGHGRAVLRIEKDKLKIKVAMDIAGKGLSVRETEKLAARLSASEEAPAPLSRKAGASPEIRDLATRLQRKLGSRVEVRHSRSGRGKLELYYRDLDELDRILALIFKR
ncbi:MAG: ParB/RepB/Spo0J family partition protein [Pseudomonadota bacterium]